MILGAEVTLGCFHASHVEALFYFIPQGIVGPEPAEAREAFDRQNPRRSDHAGPIDQIALFRRLGDRREKGIFRPSFVALPRNALQVCEREAVDIERPAKAPCMRSLATEGGVEIAKDAPDALNVRPSDLTRFGLKAEIVEIARGVN